MTFDRRLLPAASAAGLVLVLLLGAPDIGPALGAGAWSDLEQAWLAPVIDQLRGPAAGLPGAAEAAQALELLKLGRVKEAVVAAQAAVKAHPRSGPTHLARAAAVNRWDRVNRYKSAAGAVPIDHGDQVLSDADRSVDLAPDWPPAKMFRGFLKVQRHEYDAALSDLKAMTDQTAVGLTVRGLALSALGREKEALADFDQALKTEPGFHPARLYRGLARLDAGVIEYTPTEQAPLNPQKVAAALVDLDGYLKAAPGPAGYLARSKARLAQAKAAEAAADILRAAPDQPGLANLKLQIETGDLSQALAQSLSQCRRLGQPTASAPARPDLALALADLAVFLGKGQAHCLLARGRIRLERGEYDRARLDLEQAARKDRNSLVARRLLAQAYLKLNLLGWADEAASLALVRAPKAARLYLDRAEVYLALMKHQQALADLNQAVKLAPRSTTALLRRAECLDMRLGKTEPALADYNKAIELEPKSAQAYLGRGYLYERTNRPGKAMADYDRAVELDPRLLEAYRLRAALLESRGKVKAALADLDKAIELDPADADLAAWLTALEKK